MTLTDKLDVGTKHESSITCHSKVMTNVKVQKWQKLNGPNLSMRGRKNSIGATFQNESRINCLDFKKNFYNELNQGEKSVPDAGLERTISRTLGHSSTNLAPGCESIQCQSLHVLLPL